jgi:hypothetical protein
MSVARLPGFTAEISLRQNDNYHYEANSQQVQLKTGTIVPAQSRCPVGCYEANVACTGFLLWNTCWCRTDGRTCPTGGWWVGGACIGFWQLGCIGG